MFRCYPGEKHYWLPSTQTLADPREHGRRAEQITPGTPQTVHLLGPVASNHEVQLYRTSPRTEKLEAECSAHSRNDMHEEALQPEM